MRLCIFACIALRCFAFLSQPGIYINFNLRVPLSNNTFTTVQASMSEGLQSDIMSSSYRLYADIESTPYGSPPTKFDFLEFNADQMDALECYKNNSVLMRDSAFCFEMCKDLDGQLGMQTINETLEQDHVYVIDNTHLPCYFGTFFPVIEPNIIISSLIEPKKFYRNMERAMIALIIITTLLELIAVFVLYFLVRKEKKKYKIKADLDDKQRESVEQSQDAFELVGSDTVSKFSIDLPQHSIN